MHVAHSETANEFRIARRAYYYAILLPDERVPLVAWHWEVTRSHPPHIHAPLGDPLGRGRRLHIPTGGRVSLTEVVRFLIEEWEARPTRQDWERRLREADEALRGASG